MAYTFKTKNGKEVTLYNPSERGKKYSRELRENFMYNNNDELKVDKNGELRELTKDQRAYRAGYLDARRESAKIYCKKKGIPSKSTFKRSRKKK